MATAYPLLPCEVAEPWLLRLTPWQRRVIAWTCITFVSSLFFLIPLSYLCIPLLAYFGAPASAAALAAVLISLSFVPVTEWVAARIRQVLYDISGLPCVSPQRAAGCAPVEVKDERFILGAPPRRRADPGLPVGGVLRPSADRRRHRPRLRRDGLVIFRFLCARLWPRSGVAATYKSLKSGMTGAVSARPIGHNLYMLPGGLAESPRSPARTPPSGSRAAGCAGWRSRRARG